jgi:hypothetical protein
MLAVDVVEFHVRPAELGVGEVITVTPLVNGVSLVELARVVELSSATEHGEPGLAGAYAGLVVDELEQWRAGTSMTNPRLGSATGTAACSVAPAATSAPTSDVGSWPPTRLDDPRASGTRR